MLLMRGPQIEEPRIIDKGELEKSGPLKILAALPPGELLSQQSIEEIGLR